MTDVSTTTCKCAVVIFRVKVSCLSENVDEILTDSLTDDFAKQCGIDSLEFMRPYLWVQLKENTKNNKGMTEIDNIMQF